MKLSKIVQTQDAPAAPKQEIEFLSRLERTLRSAIQAALSKGDAEAAVALADARDFVDDVLAEDAPRATRVALAQSRAQLALDGYLGARAHDAAAR